MQFNHPNNKYKTNRTISKQYNYTYKQLNRVKFKSKKTKITEQTKSNIQTKEQ